MPPPTRAVLTLALGPQIYLDLATNLARSFVHWNQGSGIRFCMITDKSVPLPADLPEVEMMVVEPGRYGTGFSPKLWLDQLIPAEQNLFIDSDCLCFGPLTPLFDRFAGRAVSVIGDARTEGHFFGDIAALRRALDLPWVASFVGCLYYLERGTVTSAVYAEARSLEGNYDRLGLIRLRDVPNEEPLMALAMPRHNLRPLPDDGTIKADAMCYQKVEEIDVLRGIARVTNPLPDKNVPPVATPVLFHFNSHYTEGRFYRRECARLRLIRDDGWPAWLASAYARARHDWPMWLVETGKDFLRPVYRRFFGARAVRPGER